jgi:hypothetical protein
VCYLGITLTPHGSAYLRIRIRTSSMHMWATGAPLSSHAADRGPINNRTSGPFYQLLGSGLPRFRPIRHEPSDRMSEPDGGTCANKESHAIVHVVCQSMLGWGGGRGLCTVGCRLVAPLGSTWRAPRLTWHVKHTCRATARRLQHQTVSYI